MDDKNTQIPVTSLDDEATPDAVISETGTMEAAPAAPVIDQPTAPQPVMDITPPPQDPVISAPSAAEPLPDLATEPVESSDVAPEPPVAEAAVSEDSAAPAAAMPTSAEQTNIAPAVVSPTGVDAPVAVAPAKKSGRGMMVAIAVILALVLASAAVLFYLRSKDSKTAKTSSTGKTSKTTAAQKASTSVSTNDVDTASKGVDSSLSGLDENKDFNSVALSDKSLGLQ